MSYLIDIKGHTNMHIDSEQVPRVGETVILSPDTFIGQEGKLYFEVKQVTYSLGRGIIEELPIVMLLPTRMEPAPI
jgi:hypothetical protein